MNRRLVLAARSLIIGGVFLAAAAVFHLFATPHIAAILRKMLDAKVYGFLEPIVSFVFVLNAILLLPLSLITFISAAGVHRGERWAWQIAIISALTVLALPCTIMATMGVQYFRRSTVVSRRRTLGHGGRSLHAPRVTLGTSRSRAKRLTERAADWGLCSGAHLRNAYDIFATNDRSGGRHDKVESSMTRLSPMPMNRPVAYVTRY